MRPVLFAWRGVRIHSYPACLYLGMVVGIAVGNYASNRVGLDSGRVYLATIFLIVVGLIGARALFVASYWERYRSDPSRIWRRSEGGAAMLGGVPLMLLASFPVLRFLELPFASFWDVGSLTLLIGMMFARVGCWLNGCCCGRSTDSRFAFLLPDATGVWCRRYPTQLMEAVLTALVLVLAIFVFRQGLFPGAVILGTVAAYSFGRVVLQPLRHTQEQVGFFNVQQVLAACFGMLALMGLWSGLTGVQ